MQTLATAYADFSHPFFAPLKKNHFVAILFNENLSDEKIEARKQCKFSAGGDSFRKMRRKRHGHYRTLFHGTTRTPV